MITKFDKAFWKYELLNNKFYTIALEYKNKNPTFKSNPTIKELADRIYSEYIRKSKGYISSLNEVVCECITCNKKYPRYEIQNWHYHKRADLKYRFMDNNNRPQCYRCNCILWGNYISYAVAIADKLFKGNIKKAIAMYQDKDIKQIKDYEYIEMIEKWYKKIQEVQTTIDKNKQALLK